MKLTLLKICITPSSRDLFVIKSIQFATFVNETTVTFPLVNRLLIGILSSAFEITLAASHFDEDVIYCALGNQPAQIA